MDTILMTSGFRPLALSVVRRHWQVVDIECQREALAYLKQMPEFPVAICIGRAVDVGSDLNAWEMLSALQEIAADIPVIISTGQNSPQVIVDLVKRGAFDYVVEPQSELKEHVARYAEELAVALQRAVQYRRVVLENKRLRRDLAQQSGSGALVGDSVSMQRVYNLLAKVAPTDATVLLVGESGTGKELAARGVHEGSPRHDEPFVALNCGAFSETLIASELFGHAQGAFTGADSERPGLIREAGKGTLFLDEIATIPLSFQVMLLRVLEQRRARPVGGTGDYPVECRFVAAANRDLHSLVGQGKFREDLLYRLQVFTVEMPPLREHPEDIPALVEHFLREACQRYGREIRGVSAEALELLEATEWRGNVRELRNAVERAVIIADGDTLEASLFKSQGAGRVAPHSRDLLPVAEYEETMREFELRLLMQALKSAKGNRSEAARLLKIKRPRLNYRLKQLGVAGRGY